MTYDDERLLPPQPGSDADDGDNGQEEAISPVASDFTSRVSFPDEDDFDAPPDLSDEPDDVEDTAAEDAEDDDIEAEPEFDADDLDTDENEEEPEIEPAPQAATAPRAVKAANAPAIFVDSSAIIALVDRDDASHQAAVDAYRNLLSDGYKLFTTNHVIVETFDLLSTGVGPEIARRFLRDCKLSIYHADEQDERRARRLVLRQSGSRGLSLTDAVSLVVMERLNVGDAFAVDPGFLADAR